MSTGTPLQFAYRAAHRSGMLETGTVRAKSAEAARELLFSRGLFPLEVRLERGRDAARPRMSTQDLAPKHAPGAGQARSADRPRHPSPEPRRPDASTR